MKNIYFGLLFSLSALTFTAGAKTVEPEKVEWFTSSTMTWRLMPSGRGPVDYRVVRIGIACDCSQKQQISEPAGVKHYCFAESQKATVVQCSKAN